MIGLRLNRGGAWISLRRAEQNHADKTHHSAETLQNHDAIMAEWLMSLSVRTFARGSAHSNNCNLSCFYICG